MKVHFDVLTFEVKARARAKPKAAAKAPASTDDHQPTFATIVVLVSFDMALL